MSVWVQPLASLQVDPFALAGFEQIPVAGAHVPTSWHGSLAVHTTGLAPAHTPLWHVSVCVHASASLHVEPFALAGFEQIPVAGAHVPTSWHGSLAVHTTGLVPVHKPLWHVSDCVHALASLHEVPLVFAGFEQIPVAGVHVPTSWHESLAVHTTGLAPVHKPL